MTQTEKESYFNELFQNGLQLYREKNFYQAHDVWEELWRHHEIKDRIFIQGLIQLAASLYKVETGNMRGARSLLEKACRKFETYKGRHRGLEIARLKSELQLLQENYDGLEDTSCFDFDNIPQL